MSFSSRNILYPQTGAVGNREYPTIPQLSTPTSAVHRGAGLTFTPLHSTPTSAPQGGRGASFIPMQAHGGQGSMQLPNWQALLDVHAVPLNQLHSPNFHSMLSTRMHLPNNGVKSHAQQSPDPPLLDIAMLSGISEERGMTDRECSNHYVFEDSIDLELDNANKYEHSYNTTSSSQDINMVDTIMYDRPMGTSDSGMPL